MNPFPLRALVTACLLAALTACGSDQTAGPAPPAGLHIPTPSRAVHDVSGHDAIPFILAGIHARAAEDTAFARRITPYVAYLESLLGRGAGTGPLALDVASEGTGQWWTFLETTISGGSGRGSISAGMGWSIDDAWGAEQKMIWTVMDDTAQVGQGYYVDKATADMLGASAHEFYSHHSFSIPQQGACIWLKGHTIHSVNEPILVFNHWLRADSYDDGHNPCTGTGGTLGWAGGSSTIVCYEEWLVWYGTEVYLGDVCWAVSDNET